MAYQPATEATAATAAFAAQDPQGHTARDYYDAGKKDWYGNCKHSAMKRITDEFIDLHLASCSGGAGTACADKSGGMTFSDPGTCVGDDGAGTNQCLFFTFS